MGIPILVKRHFYTETGPFEGPVILVDSLTWSIGGLVKQQLFLVSPRPQQPRY